MFSKNQFFRIILGISVAIVALFLGAIFLEVVIHLFTLGTVPNLFQGLITLAYLYLVIGLFRLKRWALILFLGIVGLSFILDIIFVVTGGKNVLIEGFFYSMPLASTIVFSILALFIIIREIINKFNN